MTNSRDDLMALAPCPFCGGEAERIDIPTVGSDPELGGDPNAGGSCISCKRCAASTALHFDRKENLYSSWNDRAASRSAPVDREAVARLAYEAVQFMEWAIGEGFMSTELPDPADTFCDAAKAIGVEFDELPAYVWNSFGLLRPAEPVEARWRPIETAPKEGPEHPGRDFEIIVGGGEVKDESEDLAPWRPFDSWALACYDSTRGCWRGEQTEQYDCFYLHKPTHWMPKFAGPGQCEPTIPDAVGEPVEAEGVREPVAWIITWSDGETSFTRSAPSASSPKNCKYQPLYTHPQKSPDTSAAVLQEALLDATASLVAAASAYRKYASRHRRVGRAAADPFFCTRVHDFEKAAERAQAAIRQLPTTERGDK